MSRLQSIFYDETALVEKAHTFIETRTEEVLKSPNFTEISCSTLTKILKLDKLTVSELELFQVRRLVARGRGAAKGVCWNSKAIATLFHSLSGMQIVSSSCDLLFPSRSQNTGNEFKWFPVLKPRFPNTQHSFEAG